MTARRARTATTRTMTLPRRPLWRRERMGFFRRQVMGHPLVGSGQWASGQKTSWRKVHDLHEVPAAAEAVGVDVHGESEGLGPFVLVGVIEDGKVVVPNIFIGRSVDGVFDSIKARAVEAGCF